MPDPWGTAVNARIVFWGVEGAGVSTTLRRIAVKLRPDHRGELQQLPTRLDPTVRYEVLPIKLGEVGGVDTRIEVVTVPGGAEHAPTRKQLLDRVDGVVFVADCRRDRVGENVESFAELRRALAAYGRDLGAMPLVIQLNKADLADRGSLDGLLRELAAPGTASFETVAREGIGVLQVLSTISKSVVRSLREASGALRPAAPGGRAPLAPTPPREPAPPAPREPAPPPPDPWPAPVRARRPAADLPAPPVPLFDDVTGRLHRTAPPEAVQVPAAPALRIVSVGSATCQDGTLVRLPLQVEDTAGRRLTLTLTLAVAASEDL